MKVGRTRRGPRRAAFVAFALTGLGLGAAQAEDALGLRDQRFEVGGFGGIGVGGDFDGRRGETELEEGPTYAGMVALKLVRPVFVEFFYSRRPSTIQFRTAGAPPDNATAQDPPQDQFIDVGIEFYQLGATYRWESPVEWLTPFGGVSLGASRVDAVADELDDAWHFAFMGLAGVQFDFYEYFAARAQARLPFTVITEGATLFCGGVPSCDRGDGDTLTVQGEFTLGLVLKL